MYDYEIKRIKAQELEDVLQKYTGTKWELVTVVPTSATLTGPLTGEYFLVIVRRPLP
jgi:hypothetical protein